MEVKLTTVPAAMDATGTRPAGRQDSGKSVPPGGNESPPELPKADLEKIIQSIESFLATSGRELNFWIDGSSSRTVITVSNPTTNEVIRQIPSEEMLKVSAMMRSKGFHTISALA